MPRKSRELRLKQAEELYEAYVTAGVTDLYQARFISDMCYRLGLGKGLSKKQREWLDTLIEEGVPTPKGDPVLIAKIESARDVDGMQHRRQVLSDFCRKVRNGWDLSDKQENFLETMLNEAEEIRQSGKWSPSEVTVEKLRLVIQLAKGKNTWYWQHRPGVAKAFTKVKEWMQWYETREENKKIREITGTLHEPIDEPHIDEWACNKVITAYKKDLAQFENPTHLSGSIRYHRDNGYIALISGTPSVDDYGRVVYPCLVDGNLKDIPNTLLLKRRPKIHRYENDVGF